MQQRLLFHTYTTSLNQTTCLSALILICIPSDQMRLCECDIAFKQQLTKNKKLSNLPFKMSDNMPDSLFSLRKQLQTKPQEYQKSCVSEHHTASVFSSWMNQCFKWIRWVNDSTHSQRLSLFSFWMNRSFLTNRLNYATNSLIMYINIVTHPIKFVDWKNCCRLINNSLYTFLTQLTSKNVCILPVCSSIDIGLL